MLVFNNIIELKNHLRSLQNSGKTIGLVPTMGYLHDGHFSLIKKSSSENDITVVSIFVNPTQFGPNEDYETYPRDFEKDKQGVIASGGNIIFYPSVSEMYPNKEIYKTYVEVNDITKALCGASRPIHFKGVTTVVNKLFNIVRPDNAYFGQKDAQQVVVIKKMVADLNMDVNVIACAIIREADGLAMSSRNIYLNDEERKQALILHKSLELAKELIKSGEKNAKIVKKEIENKISSMNLAKIDYVSIVDINSLLDIDTIKDNVLIALAVKFGNTRLIDNCII